MSNERKAQAGLAAATGSASYPTKPPFPGVLADGSYAPLNSDKARLDYLASRPGILKNLKAGVRVTNVDTHWQASVRAALDAAMETERREIRARGGNPQW